MHSCECVDFFWHKHKNFETNPRPTNSSFSLCETHIHARATRFFSTSTHYVVFLFYFTLSFDSCTNARICFVYLFIIFSSKDSFELSTFWCLLYVVSSFVFFFSVSFFHFELVYRKLCTLTSLRATNDKKRKENKMKFVCQMAAESRAELSIRWIRNGKKLYLVFCIRAFVSNGATHDT